MKKVEVVAAIIQNDDKTLCVQRGPGKYDYISKKYEFPGGKVNEGETHEEALKREIFEELEMEVKVGPLYLTVEHQYPDFLITMHSFICKTNNPSFTLKEHIDFRWLVKEELEDLDWAAADLPIVAKLMKS